MPDVKSTPTVRGNPHVKDIHPTDYPDLLGEFLAANFPKLMEVRGPDAGPTPQGERNWREFPA